MSEQATAPNRAQSEGYFNSGRVKVIGLITAGVLLVGALGGVAGVAFDPDPQSQPDPAAPPVGAPDASAGQSALVGSPAGLAAARTAAAPAKGKFLAFQNNIQFWLPNSWRIDGGSGTEVFLSSGKGSYSYVASGYLNPQTRAGALLAHNLKLLLPRATYTQLKLSKIKVWAGAYGSVLTSVWIEYSALWVDNQGSAPIYGQIYAAVRRDGGALIALIEHIPPEGFNKAAQTGMGPLVSNSFGRFGGVA